MTRRISALVIVLLGCDEPKSTEGRVGSAQKLEPFTGPLTAERIEGAKGIVKPLEAWDRAYAQLEAQMGKPTRVREDGWHAWAVVAGDACTSMSVEKSVESKYLEGGGDAAVVGLLVDPVTVEKGVAFVDYLECAAITGAPSGPAEDPNAAGPPDAVTDVETFAKNAVAGRSKWTGKRVRVRGVLGSVSSATLSAGSTTVETHTASLLPSASVRRPQVTCTLRGDARPAAKADAAIVAEGRVTVRASLDDAGNVTLEPALEDCVLEAEP